MRARKALSLCAIALALGACAAPSSQTGASASPSATTSAASPSASSSAPSPSSQSAAGDSPTLEPKDFSSPNLSVLLNSLSIEGKQVQILSAEQAGAERATELQGYKQLEQTTFDPAACKDLLLAVYTDDPDIPAALGNVIYRNDQALARLRLYSYPTIQAAQAGLLAQAALAERCPRFSTQLPGGSPVETTVEASEYALQGADKTLLLTMGQEMDNEVVGTASTAVGFTVSNLYFIAYFDGADAADLAAGAQSDLQQAVKVLRSALQNKQ